MKTKLRFAARFQNWKWNYDGKLRNNYWFKPICKLIYRSRIEITGFEIIPGAGSDPPTVVTNYRINRIPTATTGATSSSGITDTVSHQNFQANVVTQTTAAVNNEPASSWTQSDSIFSTAPTGQPGSGSSTSLFVNPAAQTSTPTQNFPAFTSVSSEYST